MANVLKLSPAADPDSPGSYGLSGSGAAPEAQDDLPYKVELWDKAGASVEIVLAVTANASIGYAAYFAATRDHPDRQITLRFRDTTLSRWNFPSH